MTKYLTPANLKISNAEHAGLIQLAAHLAKDPVKHIPDASNEIAGSVWSDPEALLAGLSVGFNMSYQIRPIHEDGRNDYHCGSVACIGGHLSLMLQGVDALKPQVVMNTEQAATAQSYVNQFDNDVRGAEPMADLFYPYGVNNWNRITPQEAAQAIENFLTTGKPAWETIVAKLEEPDADDTDA